MLDRSSQSLFRQWILRQLFIATTTFDIILISTILLYYEINTSTSYFVTSAIIVAIAGVFYMLIGHIISTYKQSYISSLAWLLIWTAFSIHFLHEVEDNTHFHSNISIFVEYIPMIVFNISLLSGPYIVAITKQISKKVWIGLLSLALPIVLSIITSDLTNSLAWYVDEALLPSTAAEIKHLDFQEEIPAMLYVTFHEQNVTFDYYKCSIRFQKRTIGKDIELYNPIVEENNRIPYNQFDSLFNRTSDSTAFCRMHLRNKFTLEITYYNPQSVDVFNNLYKLSSTKSFPDSIFYIR